MPGEIRIERPDVGQVRVVLDNPPHNYVGARLRAQLGEALAELAGDNDVRVVVLASTGHHFSVGNDINELAALDADGASQLIAEWDDVARRLRELPAVVIASICGYALGGGFELAMSCDLRVASDDAVLACTATNFGLVMSTHTLARSLPEALAKELVLTARQVDAETALRMGLVNEVVPRAALTAATEELSAAISTRSPDALRHGKRLMRLAATLDREAHDDEQRAAFAQLASTPEHARAVNDFLGSSTERRRDD